ncbi:hypothetical protein HMSSN139_41000 [Paenibacillus sp. HMSSN-139]|nr:hypothetical protein HMSSN139_41000 [Paenibacillus sp. HMSSN-139]
MILRISAMIAEQYRTYRELSRQLAKEGIQFLRYDELNGAQRKSMETYYHDIVFPVLTPMAVDQSRPFPLVHTGFVYLAVVLKRNGAAQSGEEEKEPYFAIVQIPSNLSRIIPLPHHSNSKKQSFILIEELIRHHIQTLFSGYTPLAVDEFRLTRNADLASTKKGPRICWRRLKKSCANGAGEPRSGWKSRKASTPTRLRY